MIIELENHTGLCGPDNHYGFGGSCFPKDINSLVSYAEKLGVECNVIKSAIKTNEEVRPEQEWKQLIGRAVIENE